MFLTSKHIKGLIPLFGEIAGARIIWMAELEVIHLWGCVAGAYLFILFSVIKDSSTSHLLLFLFAVFPQNCTRLHPPYCVV